MVVVGCRMATAATAVTILIGPRRRHERLREGLRLSAFCRSKCVRDVFGCSSAWAVGCRGSALFGCCC